MKVLPPSADGSDIPNRETKVNEMKVLAFEDSESENLKIVCRDIPIPKEDEVVIKVVATTVTGFDIVRRLNRCLPIEDPLLGLECSGEIVAVGSGVVGHHVGDKVCALLCGGGYAEYIALPSWRVIPIPKGIRVDEAATLPYTTSLVWCAFFTVGKLVPNSSILIYDAAGEFGPLAIQLAKLHGCTVYATGIIESEMPYCKAFGADHCIKCGDRIADLVLETTGGRGIDFIFDPWGFGVLHMLKIISPGGTIILAGLINIDKVHLNQRHLREKKIKLVGLGFTFLSNEDQYQILQEVVEELWPRFERGELVPTMYKQRYGFHEVEAAHKTMKERVNLGDKILLIPPNNAYVMKERMELGNYDLNCC